MTVIDFINALPQHRNPTPADIAAYATPRNLVDANALTVTAHPRDLRPGDWIVYQDYVPRCEKLARVWRVNEYETGWSVRLILQCAEHAGDDYYTTGEYWREGDKPLSKVIHSEVLSKRGLL